MRKVKVFLLNGILLTLTSLAMQTIGVSFNVYISNKIGSTAVGVYQLVMSVYMFAITLASSGMNLAITKVVAEEYASSNSSYSHSEGNSSYKKHFHSTTSDIRKVVKKGLLFSFLFGFTTCVFLYIFSPFIAKHWLHSQISSAPLKILAISLPFLSMSSSINGYFSALRNVKKSAFTQVFEQVLKILLISFLINYFLPDGLEFACISLVLGSTISEICSFAMLFILYLFDTKKFNKLAFSNNKKDYSKRILKVSTPIAITSYIRSGLSTFKQLIVPIQLEKSGVSCDYALSRYGMINGMVMPLIMFPCTFMSSFSMLLIPEFSYLHVEDNYTKINFILNKIFKICFVFSFLIMGIFWSFSDELSSLIYNEIEIVKFVKLLSPLIVFMYVDNIIDSILKGLDKQVSVMAINILDLFVSISFIMFLLPINGVLGYIIVLYISEILNGFCSLFKLIKTTHFKFDFSNWILKPLFTVVFLNILFRFLCPTVITCVPEVIFCICIYSIFYLGILILGRTIVKKDITFFK